MPSATVSTIGTPSNGTWAGPRSGRNSQGGSNPNTAVTTSTPAVVVAPVVVKPAVNKTLLYIGGALLLWMVVKNHKKA
jgi:hypothetical protein